ncbi:TPA_asm: hypothetical protein G4I65_001800 [Salmonella enterica subsp. enterica serovar Newport]|uniref:Uncharacterized protein n=1 Tax=Salmonella newport TaxID=108619 RepID=A0A733UK65_SALNE|nr:hypothetical protein [Salmonella enterica subsp. enterica serovar Newport]EDZ3949578.1 hypothetical protein [Salmonella enterica]EED8162306.1 hypothetical protein [Salmonella enterica subsp. enterica]HAE3642033.1 hypothetical protein [Salmonella enterica subsp. enterica serovar Newport]HAE6009482.1 hypothetical protein [Salmonella enterica subsp. enterica serovar Newport]
MRNQSFSPSLPYRRPAERFKPDNDALVVDETNNKTKGSICKGVIVTKSSILGCKNST